MTTHKGEDVNVTVQTRGERWFAHAFLILVATAAAYLIWLVS